MKRRKKEKKNIKGVKNNINLVLRLKSQKKKGVKKYILKKNNLIIVLIKIKVI